MVDPKLIPGTLDTNIVTYRQNIHLGLILGFILVKFKVDPKKHW